MSQKLPVNGFKWVKNVSEIDEDFINNYDEDGDIGYFFKQILNNLKIYMICIVTYCFYQKE